MSLPKWVQKPPHGSPCYCDQCKKYEALSIAWEALEKMQSNNFHIGNDGQGNIFGPPDSVMCRNIVREAMRRITELGAGKEPHV